jgi:hypothetical protein
MNFIMDLLRGFAVRVSPLLVRGDPVAQRLEIAGNFPFVLNTVFLMLIKTLR